MSYAGIAIIDFFSDEEVAIETVSVTKESCDLSGIWVMRRDEESKLKSVLSEKLLLVLDQGNTVPKEILKFSEHIVSIDDFLSQAKQEAAEATKNFLHFKAINENEYETYMKVKPAERKILPKVVKKNLIEPDLSNWPSAINLDAAEEELERMNKLGSIDGAVEEVRRVLSAARLIQVLILMWKYDEAERANRQYVVGDHAVSTILPLCWLHQFPKRDN